MTKKEYHNKLYFSVLNYGYWSNEVYELNNLAIDILGEYSQKIIHDSVMILIKDRKRNYTGTYLNVKKDEGFQ